MRLRRILPDPLKRWVDTNSLTVEDSIDLLIVATAALKQCYSQGYSAMDVQTAIWLADLLQEEFTGIEENDGFINSELSIYDWAELAEYAAQLIPRKLT